MIVRFAARIPRAVARLALAMLTGTAAAACAGAPADDTLHLEGALERDGVGGGDLTAVPVDYTSAGARGEWWSCELRLTAGGCVGEHHVNAWIALPEVTTIDALGAAGCVDASGNPFGAYEQLLDLGDDPLAIGTDVSVLLLVASDVDGDGRAALDDAAETTAASLLVSGEVTVRQLAGFEDPVALTVDGATAAGNAVRLEVAGPTLAQPVAPPLDVPRTCVPGDLQGG